MFNPLLERIRQTHRSTFLFCSAVLVFSASGLIEPKVDYHRALVEALAIEKMQRQCDNLSENAAREFLTNFKRKILFARQAYGGKNRSILLAGEGADPKTLASAYVHEGLCLPEVPILTLQEILYKILDPLSFEDNHPKRLSHHGHLPLNLTASIYNFIPKYGSGLLFEGNMVGLSFVSINGDRLFGPAFPQDAYREALIVSIADSKLGSGSFFEELVERRPIFSVEGHGSSVSMSRVRVLPGLSQLAGAHGDVPLNEVREVIRSNQSGLTTNKEIELLGFAVSLNLLQYGAPVTIVLMTWYFYSLLVRLRKIIPETNPEDRQTVWIGVFPERGPIIATLFSVVFLPVLAIVSLHWSISGRWDVIWDALFFKLPLFVSGEILFNQLDWLLNATPSVLIVLAISIVAYRKTSEVRRRLR